MIHDTTTIKALMDADIQSIKLFLKMIPIVKTVIEEFDGKVLNIRLEKAINERIKKYGWVSIEANSPYTSTIKFYPADKHVKYTDSYGKESWIHSKWFDNHLLYCDKVFQTQRIESAVILPYLDKFKEFCTSQIKSIRSDKGRIEQYFSKGKRSWNQLRSLIITLNRLPEGQYRKSN